MSEIITLLACLNPVLNDTLIRQLTCIAEAMLAMSGRITMLGLSRYTSQGGSYRTIQRFFNQKFNWPSIRWLLIRRHLRDKNDTVLIAGDEVNVSIRSKKTYGLGRFFSSLSGKTIPSLYFLNLSLISVRNRCSSPLMMEQIMPDVIKSSKVLANESNRTKKETKPGRPLGSKNKNRSTVELSKYLQLVQATLKNLLNRVNSEINLTYFLFDGAFGNSMPNKWSDSVNFILSPKCVMILPFICLILVSIQDVGHFDHIVKNLIVVLYKKNI